MPTPLITTSHLRKEYVQEEVKHSTGLRLWQKPQQGSGELKPRTEGHKSPVLDPWPSGTGVTTQALRDVSLTITAGEFVAIMGPSGSGKSTLLHILGFLDRPSAGQYFFDDHEMNEYDEAALAVIRNQKMGFIFQAFNLLPRTSVLENVLLPLRYSNVPKREWVPRAEEAIASVKLSYRREHVPSQLSGGEKQRVAIARALVNRPLVIFADEPTGNLDSVSGQAVMETIESLHQEGRTVVLITHETVTAQYAQRIVQLKDGMIVSDQTAGASPQLHYHK